jgi:hypothetical protein
MLGVLAACKSPMVVGEYHCPSDRAEAGALPSSTDPIAVPWSTGFENQLECDYRAVAGYCYGWDPYVRRIVSHPVHSGEYAAEFTVKTGTDAGEQPQARCVRRGVLPTEAYYGAWFYLRERSINDGLWNLVHFQGGNADGTSFHNLIDVSVTERKDGELKLFLINLVGGGVKVSPPIPIGEWFHVVVYLKRAKDETGTVALYLNDVRVAELTNVITDDSELGEWYVGNLATALEPSESTVYVDDVTIRSTL